MRRPVTLLLVLALLFTPFPASAGEDDSKLGGFKDSGQKDNGDVTLIAESDGSLTQPRPRGGRLSCTLHDIIGTVGQGIVAIGILREPTEVLEEEWYYWLVCRDADDQIVVERLFQYLPGTTIISPAELAQRATNELAIPYPEPRTSPSIAINQLVGIDTWMWIDPAAWQPITATAAIPGLSVSATATPRHITWDMGDGTTVVCDGPGTPYDDTRREADQSTDCSHTYQDRGAYTATATVTWAVTWSASDGSTGSLADVSRTTQFPMNVAERQAVGR